MWKISRWNCQWLSTPSILGWDDGDGRGGEWSRGLVGESQDSGSDLVDAEDGKDGENRDR